MMETVRQWLLGVTCVSLMAALADGLMPKGAVRQIGRLVCALVLLCVVLRPVLQVRVPDLKWALSDLEEQIEDNCLQLEQNRGQMMKTLIERECGAYIVDKAAEVGVVCLAQVECTLADGTVWLPHRACVSGQFDSEQIKWLTVQVNSGLGIPPERLVYTGGE